MFTFTHTFIYMAEGHSGLPYRSTRSWKTINGARRAAEAHAKGIEPHYDMNAIKYHRIEVIDLSTGRAVLREAA
jgi:hypothetical protein